MWSYKASKWRQSVALGPSLLRQLSGPALPRRGTQSSVFLGRQYEMACQRLLRTIGIDSRLMGGPSDGGIDLQGSWCLEPRADETSTGTGGSSVSQPDRHSFLPSPKVPVIVQCKYITRTCPPAYVRELEGTLGRWPGSIGLLISSKVASRACVEAISISSAPLLFLHYDTDRVKKAVANAALHRHLPTLVIASRHVEGGLVEPVFMIKG